MARQTQVGIVGAGPAGLVLANLLLQADIDAVVLERSSRAHIEARARAGFIEHRTVELLRHHGLAGGLLASGIQHTACEFRFDGERLRVPYAALADDCAHYVYPQQNLVKDLADMFIAAGGTIRFEHAATAIAGVAGGRPRITSRAEASEQPTPLELDCDFVAGCDGFHGPSRSAIPELSLRTVAREYDIGWLAVLAAVPPFAQEVVYAQTEAGFAGQMPRTADVTRFYLQCPRTDTVDEWPDERIWEELAGRFGAGADGPPFTTGPILEKGVLEMRSVVTEPMQHGSLFLAGDAAHVLTPIGAKGMNLAIGDAEALAQGLIAHYRHGDDSLLTDYSARRLGCVWAAQEFSDWMLHLIHAPDRQLPDWKFWERLRFARLRRLAEAGTYASAFAQAYVGSGPV